jgi:hypothetical protein
VYIRLFQTVPNVVVLFHHAYKKCVTILLVVLQTTWRCANDMLLLVPSWHAMQSKLNIVSDEAVLVDILCIAVKTIVFAPKLIHYVQRCFVSLSCFVLSW